MKDVLKAGTKINCYFCRIPVIKLTKDVKPGVQLTKENCEHVLGAVLEGDSINCHRCRRALDRRAFAEAWGEL